MEGFHGDRMMLFYHICVLLHSSLSILPLGGTYIVLGFGVYLWALLNFGHRMFPARPMSSDDPKTLPKQKVGNQLLHEIWNFYVDGILKLLTILFIPKFLYFFLAPVHTYLKSTVNSVFHTLLCHIINNMSYFIFTTRRLHWGLQTVQNKYLGHCGMHLQLCSQLHLVCSFSSFIAGSRYGRSHPRRGHEENTGRHDEVTRKKPDRQGRLG